MAKLSIFDSDIETRDFDKISNFLDCEGIDFGRFELTELAHDMSKKQTLSDVDREILISEFPELTEKYSKLPGFRSDVICLYPEFDHLDFVLKKFKDIHYHFENEHWYLIDGSCGFAFLGSSGRKYVIEIEKNEFITVREGKWQWLIPPANNRMKSMRYFNRTGLIREPSQLII